MGGVGAAEFGHPSDAAGAYLAVVAARCDSAGGAWRCSTSTAERGAWIIVRHAAAATPPQGWKIHISASERTAAGVLAAAVSVLVEEPCAFKLAASPADLAALNDGSGGLSQIGKFVTVYPSHDGQAVRLARRLAAATRGLRGPAIRSDRPLQRGSVVHYRYGGFDGVHVRTSLGEFVPALRAPDGTLVPDTRLTAYRPPEWAQDPFLAAGVAEPLPGRSRLLAGRYLVVATLDEGPAGTVELGVDVAAARRCILKRRGRESSVDADGRDAHDRLRREAAVLERLAPDPRFPAPLALFEDEDDLVLAMDDVGDETLGQHVADRYRRGERVSDSEVIRWGRELASALAAIHAHGLVHRDLKSSNVLVASDGSLRLVDFDLADAPSGAPRPHGRGTRGYMSPEQRDGASADPRDDVYALGALLHLAATGADPASAPRPGSLLDRPLELLGPSLGAGLAAVIRRCLAEERRGRYASAAAVEDGLGRAARDARPAGRRRRSEPVAAEHLARRLGDTLCAEVAEWQPADSLARSGDLAGGTSGAVLALAELVAASGEPTHRAALGETARALADAGESSALPGLYVGEAGVAAACLRAGQVLGDGCLVAAASARGAAVAAQPHGSPDLFHGTAGRLRFHLLLLDETGDDAALAAATAAGHVLLARAEPVADGGLHWRIPPGYGGLSGNAYVGYAHGAAGIADALLELHDVTGETCFRDAAAETARWLTRLAVPWPDGRGAAWPVTEGGAPAAPFWCHGAAGVGRFLLAAAEAALVPRAEELAIAAAWAVAHGSRWAGPTQCHGLSGGIEYLLDVHRATGDRRWLDEARSLGRLLEAHLVETQGLLRTPPAAGTAFDADCVTGYGGAALCLLRLADPERRPHHLSRRGFRVPAANREEVTRGRLHAAASTT